MPESCGAAGTLWRHQPEYNDAEIIKVATHSVIPNPSPDWCSNPHHGYANRFSAGARVWVAVYLRDKIAKVLAGQPGGSFTAGANRLRRWRKSLLMGWRRRGTESNRLHRLIAQDRVQLLS